MRPTDLVDDRDPKPVRFGGRRKKGAPVLRLVRTRSTSRMFLGALAGLVVGFGALNYGAHLFIAIAAMALGCALGGVVGARERDDICATCEGSLSLDDKECHACEAPIAGEITNRKDRAAGEEQLRLARVAARKRAEAEGKPYEEDADD